eukprot:jgi/Ulvmu1/10125/UM006_0078.1
MNAVTKTVAMALCNGCVGPTGHSALVPMGSDMLSVKIGMEAQCAMVIVVGLVEDVWCLAASAGGSQYRPVLRCKSANTSAERCQPIMDHNWCMWILAHFRQSGGF